MDRVGVSVITMIMWALHDAEYVCGVISSLLCSVQQFVESRNLTLLQTFL